MPPIRERVLKVIANRHPDILLEGETRLREDAGMDSLDLMDLVMDLEDEFSINIPEDRYAPVKTLGDIILMLEKHCEQANEECE